MTDFQNTPNQKVDSDNQECEVTTAAKKRLRRTWGRYIAEQDYGYGSGGYDAGLSMTNQNTPVEGEEEDTSKARA